MEHKEAFEEIDVKHIERYTSEEKNHYEGIAVVLGYLARTFNKITLTHFNKIWVELGNERIQRDDLEFYMDVVKEEDVFSQLFEDAIDGKVSIEDIPNYEGESITKDKTIKDIISPYQVQHQRTLANNREFSKVQREGAYLKMLMDDLKTDLSLEFSELAKPKYDFRVYDVNKGKSTTVILLSDWHVGAEVFNDHSGGYNLEVLKNRLTDLLRDVKRIVETTETESIRVYFLGDAIEGAYMRAQQSWGNELTMSEQIATFTRLITDFIMEVETFGRGVKFGIVGGNHDRLSGDKKQNIYYDSAAYIILDTLLMLKEQGMFKLTEIIDNRDDIYRFEDTIYGKVFYAVHGDALKSNGAQINNLIKKHPIDYLVTGHVHHFKAIQEDFDRVHITVGSIMGSNDYAKEMNLSLSDASQTVLVVSEDMDPIVYTKYFNKGSH